MYEGEFKEYLRKQTITENLNYKDYAETYIESQIKCIKNVLLENHFIDSEDKLTEKGTIACNVHEMNNLVFLICINIQMDLIPILLLILHVYCHCFMISKYQMM